MTTEDRARKIDALIEATPEAVALRSESLDALVGGNTGLAIFLAWKAAEVVMAAHPEVRRELIPAALRHYLWSQVVALCTGALAELDLLPALD